MAAGVRQKVILACTECKQRNYNTMKNKRNNPDRIDEVLQVLQQGDSPQGDKVTGVYQSVE